MRWKEGMRELQKKKKKDVGVGEKKTFAMPIIFKELRPRTRISKMENAGIHHAVGRKVGR